MAKNKINEINKEISSHPKKQKKQPGIEKEMYPQPEIGEKDTNTLQKLKNKVAIITGGDSGIGHAVAVFFAKAGADVVVAYLNEHEDAHKVKKQIEKIGRQCLLISGDLSEESFCKKVVERSIHQFGKIDILVNNAAQQHPKKSIQYISSSQLMQTFATNVFSYFYMIKAALPFLKRGSTIINTSSVTCYKGSKYLLDYSATKGAIVALTRSLSEALVKKGIRVNGVAPGPVWTPLISSTFSLKHIKNFGKNVPMQRPAQPEEIAPSYVFLACEDSSYMSGQILHPNGGTIVNG
jgi:NAD(P)-dependent dehydrogenase (short-subunit alcohol dehydrogenase family)